MKTFSRTAISFFAWTMTFVLLAPSIALAAGPIKTVHKHYPPRPEDSVVEKTEKQIERESSDQDNKRREFDRRSDRGENWFFHDIPRHIGNDLKETFWNGWHLLLLAGGAGATIAIHEYDPEIRGKFKNRPLGSKFDKAMNLGFHPFVLAGATATAFGFSKLANADKAALTAGTMFEALAITGTITFGLQLATHRGRPDGSGNTSFPSAHTSSAFALATVAEVYYGPWVGVPSYLLAGLIGISRLDANKHAASDVMAGALLGTLVGLGTAKFHKKEFSNFFISPTAGNGAPGISLVKLF